MDELTLDGEIYLSSKRAAKVTGYAKDYVGQLCREGRVEARLVGRNWYVLETSIREHRFGTSVESKKTGHGAPAQGSSLEKPVESTPNHHEAPVVRPQTPQDAWKAWTPPVYVPESTPLMIPAVGAKQASVSAFPYEPVRAPAYNPLSETPNVLPVVEEMQSAWKDWFTRKEERMLLEETPEVLLESPDIIEARESSVSTSSQTPEESVPVTLQKVSETLQQKEEAREDTKPTENAPKFGAFITEEDEAVRIRRSYTAAKREYAAPVVTPVFNTASQSIAPKRSVQQAAVEKRHMKQPKTKRGSSILLKTLFVLVAFVAAGTAILGTGKVDQYLVQTSSHNKFVQILDTYLGGESFVNKT